MKAFLFLALTFFSVTVLADLFQERQQLAGQRAAQQRMQETSRLVHIANQEELANLAAFGKKFGGYAVKPTCVDFSYERNSSRNGVRQECGSGLCVNVQTRYSRPRSYGNADWIYHDIVMRGQLIYYCSVALNNGYACQVQNDLDRTTYGGTCYDAAGNSRELKIKMINFKR